jgi:hypothetical protein
MNRSRAALIIFVATGIAVVALTIAAVVLQSPNCNDDPGEPIGTCNHTKPLGNNVRLSVCANNIIDIRQFVRTSDSTQSFRSTIKGINLSREQWREILKLVAWVQCHLYK